MTKRAAVRTQWAGAGCLTAAAVAVGAEAWSLVLGAASGLVVAGAALLFFGWAGEIEAVKPAEGGEG